MDGVAGSSGVVWGVPLARSLLRVLPYTAERLSSALDRLLTIG